MNSTDKTPIFNLKAVVRETGLKPDTLRAWERRYGLPTPQRTESGHRLYSQHDIEMLKWLIARQDEGLSISRAVELWRQLEEEGGSLLRAGGSPPKAVQPGITPPPAPRVADAPNNNLGELRAAWVDACLQFDEMAAENVLAQAFALFPAETVCIHVLQGGLVDVGDGWHQGRITVQQEHFASALAIRRMEAMLSGTPAPTRAGRVMVGCPPEEEHTFIPVMLSLLLRRKGFHVIYLGANIPLHSLESTIRLANPSLVILTAQQLFTAATLLEMAQLLQEQGTALAFGGLVFRNLPELVRVIPGYYLGDRIDNAVQAIEQIMVYPRPQPAQRETPRNYLSAAGHFRARQSQIEADVWRQLGAAEGLRRQLANANANMGRNIQAALLLGNMGFLGPDIRWIENLLVTHYRIPSDMLDRYLEAYHRAVRANLGDEGELVARWLSQLVHTEADAESIAGRVGRNWRTSP